MYKTILTVGYLIDSTARLASEPVMNTPAH